MEGALGLSPNWSVQFPGIARSMMHFGKIVFLKAPAAEHGRKLLHKNVTETRFPQVSAGRLPRSAGGKECSRSCASRGPGTGARGVPCDTGWGQCAADSAEHRFRHRFVPDCHNTWESRHLSQPLLSQKRRGPSKGQGGETRPRSFPSGGVPRA